MPSDIKVVESYKKPVRVYLFMIFLFMIYVRPYEIGPLSVLAKIRPAFLFMGLALAGYLAMPKKPRISKESAWIWFIMIQVSAIISFFPSVWRSMSVDWFIESNMRLIILFYILMIAVKKRVELMSIINCIFISCTFVGARVILAYKSGQYFFDHGARRVVGVGTLGSDDPNDLALILAMSVILGLFLLFTRKGFAKVFYAACIGVVLIGLVLTGSRGGYLGLGMGIVVFFGLLYRRQKMKFVALMLVLFALAAVSLPQEYKHRFMLMFSDEEYSKTDVRHGRVETWKRAMRALAKRPVGYGLKNSSIAEGEQKKAEGIQGGWMVIHNSYLQVGLELGVFGLFCYVMFLISGFANIKKILGWCRGSPQLREYETCACALAGGLGAFLISSFFLSQGYYWNQYIFIALTVMLKRVVAPYAPPPPKRKKNVRGR